jgi:hypothetical protein
VGVVKGGVGNGAPISMYGVVNACLIEQQAFPCDVLWSAEGSAARAGECLRWVCGSEPLCIGACECVVDRKLECSGSGSTGVEQAFCFLALHIFLHVYCC